MDNPIYPLVLERWSSQVEEGALWDPEVFPTHIRQSAQSFLLPPPNRHPGLTPRPDTQAQHLGTGQQQHSEWKRGALLFPTAHVALAQTSSPTPADRTTWSSSPFDTPRLEAQVE